MYCRVHVFIFPLLLLLYWSVDCRCANSHWIVTQDGKINKQVRKRNLLSPCSILHLPWFVNYLSQEGSPFDLHQYHNLFSLLEQERRISKLHHLHQSLLHQKHEFQEIVDLDGYLVEKPVPMPSDCSEIKALSNHDLTLSTVISLTDKNIKQVLLKI